MNTYPSLPSPQLDSIFSCREMHAVLSFENVFISTTLAVRGIRIPDEMHNRSSTYLLSEKLWYALSRIKLF